MSNITDGILGKVVPLVWYGGPEGQGLFVAVLAGGRWKLNFWNSVQSGHILRNLLLFGLMKGAHRNSAKFRFLLLELAKISNLA